MKIVDFALGQAPGSCASCGTFPGLYHPCFQPSRLGIVGSQAKSELIQIIVPECDLIMALLDIYGFTAPGPLGSLKPEALLLGFFFWKFPTSLSLAIC